MSETPKFLKKKGDPNHIYHIFTEGLAARGDMEPFEPKGAATVVAEALNQPVPVPVIETVQEQGEAEQHQPVNVPIPEAEAAEIGRAAVIKAAIATIPVEQYAKAGMGRPAMPKVGDVSKAAGFKVTVDEVVAALGEKKED